jgi:hypothetical protein
MNGSVTGPTLTLITWMRGWTNRCGQQGDGRTHSNELRKIPHQNSSFVLNPPREQRLSNSEAAWTKTHDKADKAGEL